MPGRSRPSVVPPGGPLHFASEEEILEHWRSLFVKPPGSLGAQLAACSELDLTYSPGDGREYVVSLATPADCDGLCALGEEFVRSHSEMYTAEYGDVSHDTWCLYLGLDCNLTDRRREHELNVSQNIAQGKRFNYRAVCHSGCTLKCECRWKATAATRDRSSPQALPRGGALASGAGTVLRSGAGARLGPYGKPPPPGTPAAAGAGAAPAPAAAGPQPAPPELRRNPPRGGAGGGRAAAGAEPGEIVGYVHFTMEESPEAKQQRCSKRLKRKRGESTGEYTKVSHLVVTRGHGRLGLGKLLLTAVMHRVCRIDPSYARELFLTVIERNTVAVRLYQGLGLRVVGKNITHVGKDLRRPVMWYQMNLERTEAGDGGGDAEDEDMSTTAASSTCSSAGWSERGAS